MIMAHCSLDLTSRGTGSSQLSLLNSQDYRDRVLLVAQARFKFLGSSNPSTSASQSSGNTGLSLSPKLDCSGTIKAHYSLEVLGSINSPASAS
ncbi:hypothetical protein AAY473_026290, partial [Plecturocebus cupreus]